MKRRRLQTGGTSQVFGVSPGRERYTIDQLQGIALPAVSEADFGILTRLAESQRVTNYNRQLQQQAKADADLYRRQQNVQKLQDKFFGEFDNPGQLKVLGQIRTEKGVPENLTYDVISDRASLERIEPALVSSMTDPRYKRILGDQKLADLYNKQAPSVLKTEEEWNNYLEERSNWEMLDNPDDVLGYNIQRLNPLNFKIDKEPKVEDFRLSATQATRAAVGSLDYTPEQLDDMAAAYYLDQNKDAAVNQGYITIDTRGFPKITELGRSQFNSQIGVYRDAYLQGREDKAADRDAALDARKDYATFRTTLPKTGSGKGSGSTGTIAISTNALAHLNQRGVTTEMLQNPAIAAIFEPVLDTKGEFTANTAGVTGNITLDTQIDNAKRMWRQIQASQAAPTTTAPAPGEITPGLDPLGLQTPTTTTPPQQRRSVPAKGAKATLDALNY